MTINQSNSANKVKVVLPNTPSPQQGVGFSVNEAMENLNKNLPEMAQQIFKNFAEELTQFTQKLVFPVFEKLGEIADEYRKESVLMAPLLQESQLWLTQSAPLELFFEIRNLRISNNATPETIQKAFISYYSENNYFLLDEAITEWGRQPLFAKRMLVIQDAVEAHKQGMYTLSIPALLPMFEGITRDALGEDISVIKGFEKIIEKSDDKELSSVLFVDLLIELIKSSFLFGHIPFSQYDQWLINQGKSQKDFLNRHTILHGVQTEYATEINSLRVFLLLDGLLELLMSQGSSLKEVT